MLPTKPLSAAPDYIAPDGSEIRRLVDMPGGGLCHCSLLPGCTSHPVAHRGVEELWYCIEGEGEVWRKCEGVSAIITVGPGDSLGIPPRTAFQFRNTGDGPLCFLIATLPPWPGPEEAVDAEGAWKPSVRPTAQ